MQLGNYTALNQANTGFSNVAIDDKSISGHVLRVGQGAFSHRSHRAHGLLDSSHQCVGGATGSRAMPQAGSSAGRSFCDSPKLVELGFGRQPD
jgi:hypothetical protein